MQLDQLGPQVGIRRQQPGRCAHELVRRLVDRHLLRVSQAGGRLGRGQVPVRVHGVEQGMAQVVEAAPAAERAHIVALLLGQAPFQRRQAAGQRGQRVAVHHARRHCLEQLGKGDRALALQRLRVELGILGHAHGIHDDEALLAPGVAGDDAQVVGADHPRPAPDHLLEEHARLDRAQEEQHLQRLDVGAGGDHVHGDGDARVVGVAELGDQLFGRLAADAVGDLLAEVVALAKLLADDVDDGLGVAVVFGEDQGLGHNRAAGEDLGEEAVAVGAHDGADLVGRHDLAVELAGGIVELVVELLPALLAGQPVAPGHPEAGLDGAALLRHPRADAIDLAVYVDAVGHGALRANTP